MGDDLKKVRTGDPLRIPAATFNAFVDAVADLRRRQRSVTRESTPGHRQATIIPVRNDSGADLDRFSVLGFSEPIIGPDYNADEFKSRAMAVGMKPVVPDHRGRFAVLIEPAKAGAVAMGCVSGVIPCQINVDDETHQRADVEHDQTILLTGHHGGAEILWKESGIGLKWALIKIGLAVPLAVTFDVRLEQVYGEPGVNGEADCTFEYDLYEIHTNEKLNGDTPLAPVLTSIRPTMTQMVAATRGTAYWTVKDNKVVVELEEAFEKPTPRVEQYVVTSISCGPGGGSPGSDTGYGDGSGGGSGSGGSAGSGIQITYQTARVFYPPGTRIEPGPEFTINCDCNCGSGST